MGWVFGVTAAALFMTALDNLVVVTALPVIKGELGASLTGLEWTVNGYTLPFALLLLPGVALADRYGRRRLFVLGLGLFASGSAAAALSTSAEALIAARAIQGAGGGIVTPLTLTLLSAGVSPFRRGLALGVLGAISGLAIALGPLWRGDRAGLVLAVDLLAERLIGPLAGFLSDHIGSRRLVVAGTASMAVALGWLAAISSPTVPYWALAAPFLLAGVGMSLFFAPTANAALLAVERRDEGIASGVLNTIRQVGAALGVAVLAAVFSLSGSYESPAAFVSGLSATASST